MRGLWLLVFVLALPLSRPVRAEPAFQLQKPIACTIGRDCVIQQYPDHDPGPGVTDYACGPETYDGHTGTDFRIPDKAAQARGVTVIAAAPGVVKTMRDGLDDFDVGTFDRAKVRGMDCGNSVLIVHVDGWQTLYCHMRKGSVRVKAGDRVETGQPIGLVGQSGDAAFPHLHLEVRRNRTWVDPFADRATCGQGSSLWADAARAELVYQDIDVLNAGFAATSVTMDDVERGGIAAPGRQSPALAAYVRALHLRMGDVQQLIVRTPDGQSLVSSTLPPVDHDKAEVFILAGKKKGLAAWPAGTYSATYTVTRSGRIVLTKTFVLKE